MLILLAIFSLLLLAGSLFPWQYQAGPDLGRSAWHVLHSWNQARSEGSVHDVLVNLVIYVPIGFTAYLWTGWRSHCTRWAGPILAGLCLSFSIETLQTYFPPRAPGFIDVSCNTLSAAAGALLAAVFQTVLETRHVEWRRRYSVHLSSALLLLALWAAASAWPVHPFPLGIGTRIRALLKPEPWLALPMFSGAIVWFQAGCLLTAVTGTRMARWFLWLLLPGILLAMLLAPGHELTRSYAAGALASVIIFWLLPERHRHPTPWLAGLWLAWIMLEGLRPFMLLAQPYPFNWLPFKDLLSSSWMPAIGVLLTKTWKYGAAFWLLAHTRLSHGAAIILTLMCILSIETAQCWLPGRSAGLTDPALALLAAALLWLVDHRFSRQQEPLM